MFVTRIALDELRNRRAQRCVKMHASITLFYALLCDPFLQGELNDFYFLCWFHRSIGRAAGLIVVVSKGVSTGFSFRLEQIRTRSEKLVQIRTTSTGTIFPERAL